jgi:primosomal protein N'
MVAMTFAHQKSASSQWAVHSLSPTSAPIECLRGRCRHRFLLRAKSRLALRTGAQMLVRRIEESVVPARASLDIDPFSMS